MIVLENIKDYQNKLINIENNLYIFNIDIKEEVIIKQLKKVNNNLIHKQTEYKNLNTLTDILTIMNGKEFEAFLLVDNSIIMHLVNYQNLYFLIEKEEVDFNYLMPPM